MNLPHAPIVHEGFFATHFFTVRDQGKSKDFYVRILGGKVITRYPWIGGPTFWSFRVSWSTSRCRLPGTLGRCVEKVRLSWPALEASPQVGPARPAAHEKAAGRQYL